MFLQFVRVDASLGFVGWLDGPRLTGDGGPTVLRLVDDIPHAVEPTLQDIDPGFLLKLLVLDRSAAGSFRFDEPKVATVDLRLQGEEVGLDRPAYAVLD